MPPFARRMSLTEPLAGMMENPKLRQGLSVLSSHLYGSKHSDQEEETKDDNSVQFEGAMRDESFQSFQSESTLNECHLSFNRHVAFHCSLSSVGSEYGEEEKEEDDFNVDDAMCAQRRLETSVLGICSFLRNNGADRQDVNEMVTMQQRLQYTALLKRGEVLTEDILINNNKKINKKRSDEVLNMFVTAWDSLHEYSQDRYQQIYQAHSKMQMQLWKQQMARVSGEDDEEEDSQVDEMDDTSRIGASLRLWRSGDRGGGMDEPMGGSTRLWSSDRRSMLRRQSRRSSLMEEESAATTTAQEAAELASQLSSAMRFKIDCQKQQILTKEWARCLQRQMVVVDVDC